MPLRFIHTADLHLGSPFVGLEKVEPRVASKLRRSMFDVWNAIVERSISEDVDVVMIAGDVLDGADRSVDAQSAFQSGIVRLHECGIRSFVCHGNHDSLDAWTNEIAFPDSCHRFGPEVEEVLVDPDDPDKGAVVGVSYASSEVTENLALQFQRSDSAPFTIGLLHCNVAYDPHHAAFSPCTMEDLRRTGIDYWALGHIHNRKVVREDSTTIVYPGIPQGRHPGEPGPRGVALVTIDDAARADVEFRAVDQVRWQRVRHDISAVASIEALSASVIARLRDELDGADGRSLVTTMRLTGQPAESVVQRLGSSRFISDLARNINETLSHGDPWLWCQRISPPR